MDYRDSDLFHTLEDTVKKQNAWKLGLTEPVSPTVTPGSGSQTSSPRASHAGADGEMRVSGMDLQHSTTAFYKAQQQGRASKDGGGLVAPPSPTFKRALSPGKAVPALQQSGKLLHGAASTAATGGKPHGAGGSSPRRAASPPLGHQQSGGGLMSPRRIQSLSTAKTTSLAGSPSKNGMPHSMGAAFGVQVSNSLSCSLSLNSFLFNIAPSPVASHFSARPFSLCSAEAP